ncbi:MAG TPA: galactose-1-phosphate uridylyltransferase [Anaeromyxobacteraceae bacterium]|jgi:UDPglucose--hexose-1-phosphate uridylyltransferase|nr:galactose-1-phosphate uridylyltransferase [Anaeromyxobacteraceae bacterium]
MPELRRDPIVGRWVIIATERAHRPQQPNHPPEPSKGLCPFCPGSEDKTPREVYVAGRAPAGAANGGGWRVRVVPNRFPALMIEGELERQAEGIYDRMNGIGAHEVIVETPDHGKTLADLSDEDVTEVLFAYKARILDLRNDQRFRYILLFKNSGAAAGASLEHSHSQLIALPITPRQVSEEIEGARRHFEHRERCIFCDIVGQERKDRSRLVYENEEFVAFAPWAPRSPFETWILPKRHESNFEAEPKERLAYCAQALRATLRRIGAACGNPAYNFMVHSNPLRDPSSPSYHWHVEVMPALSQSVAGFEWGSGFHINPVPPEEAAEFLRKVST